MSQRNFYSLRRFTHPHVQNIDEVRYADTQLSNLYLQERFGIIDYDSRRFWNVFKSFVTSAMGHDRPRFSFWNYEIVKLYNNADTKYFKYCISGFNTEQIPEYSNNKNFLDYLNTIQLYITFHGPKNTATTIAHDLSTDELNEYNPDELPLYCKDKNNKITASIIITLTDAKQPIDDITNMIYHEFMHLVKGTQNPTIDINSSNSNGIALQIMHDLTGTELIPGFNDLIVIYNELSRNNWKFYRLETLVKFIAACVYYSDEGERSSYLVNFRGDCIQNLKNGYKFPEDYSQLIGYDKIDQQNKKYFSEFFSIYNLLFEILNNSYKFNNKQYISIESNIQTNPQFETFFDEFTSYYSINELTKKYSYKQLPHDDINSYGKFWDSCVKNWIHKAKAIYKSYGLIYGNMLIERERLYDYIINKSYLEDEENNMSSPYKAIKLIVETYLDNYEQIQNVLKQDASYNKKRTAKTEKNQDITLSLFGGRLFKSYMMHGNMDTFAPVPLNAVKLTKNDIESIYKKFMADDDTLAKYTDKVMSYIKKEYSRNQFKFQGEDIATDINFRTFDELCDFVATVYEGVYKSIRNLPDDCINWKPFVSKFRAYLK